MTVGNGSRTEDDDLHPPCELNDPARLGGQRGVDRRAAPAVVGAEHELGERKRIADAVLAAEEQVLELGVLAQVPAHRHALRHDVGGQAQAVVGRQDRYVEQVTHRDQDEHIVAPPNDPVPIESCSAAGHSSPGGSLRIDPCQGPCAGAAPDELSGGAA